MLADMIIQKQDDENKRVKIYYGGTDGTQSPDELDRTIIQKAHNAKYVDPELRNISFHIEHYRRRRKDQHDLFNKLEEHIQFVPKSQDQILEEIKENQK